MNTSEMLKTIGKRCSGEIYLGVVGPVRVGKSTFIREFMRKIVLPYIDDEALASRMRDELPQAGVGRTIMTTEPKFVPNTAARIHCDDMDVSIRLIDCVGYVISQAKGYMDEDGMRMVKTPWDDEPVPFHEAARTGTGKVISDHSTIGIVMTSDGTITDIERESYMEAEGEIIEQLKAIGKPFIVLVNSKNPQSEICQNIVTRLAAKHDACVLAINANAMDETTILNILKQALYEFPVSSIHVNMPKWIEKLDDSHLIKQSINQTIQESISHIEKLREVDGYREMICDNEYIEQCHIQDIDAETGSVLLNIKVYQELYGNILKEIIGENVKDKGDLISLLQDFAKAKKEYDAIASALKMVKTTGYGFAGATLSDITLSTPELIKSQNRYGVSIKALAPSIHMIKVDVESVFEPIIGSKEQSEELIRYLLKNDSDDQAIWESEIFGRKLSDIIRDGLNAKLSTIPDAAQIKLQDILSKLVNKGKGNVIAIVL